MTNVDVVETLPATTPATLEMNSISKSYGGVAALTDVSVEVVRGEVHAILGENGAGKSTLMNVATGNTQPDGGEITVGGVAVGTLSPTLAATLGIAIVHQHPAVLPDLTVLENLEVALPGAIFAGRKVVDVAHACSLASTSTCIWATASKT